MRWRTSSIASLRSVPQVKFIRTCDEPSLDVDVSISRPDTALICCSSGRVTSSSISSGPTLHSSPARRRSAASRRAEIDRQSGERDDAEQDDDAADHHHRDRAMDREARNAHDLFPRHARRVCRRNCRHFDSPRRAAAGIVATCADCRAACAAAALVRSPAPGSTILVAFAQRSGAGRDDSIAFVQSLHHFDQLLVAQSGFDGMELGDLAALVARRGRKTPRLP